MSSFIVTILLQEYVGYEIVATVDKYRVMTGLGSLLLPLAKYICVLRNVTFMGF